MSKWNTSRRLGLEGGGNDFPRARAAVEARSPWFAITWIPRVWCWAAG